MKKNLALVIGVLLLVSSYFYGNWYSEQKASQTAPEAAIEQAVTDLPNRDELLNLVNEERAKRGVAPLVVDERIQKVAQIKADDMHKRNYISHEIPGTGTNLTPEMNDLLMDACVRSGENIRQNSNTNTSKSAFYAWKSSEPHYEAMIDPNFTTTGFGISGDKIVQAFCVAK